MDDRANQLAELEVTRSRTMADLETVQAATVSVKKTIDNCPARQFELNGKYIEKLANDDLTEDERKALYKEWKKAFKASVDDYDDLVAERERLHVQETVLVRMLVEIDFRIKTIKDEMV